MADVYIYYLFFLRALKNSIAENPYFVMEFLNILNTELRIRSVFDYKTMKKANNNDVIIPPLLNLCSHNFPKKEPN